MKPADAVLLRAAVERWQSDGSGECPKCGGSTWKMSEPPICVGCGFVPIRSSEAMHRIEALADLLEKIDRGEYEVHEKGCDTFHYSCSCGSDGAGHWPTS